MVTNTKDSTKTKASERLDQRGATPFHTYPRLYCEAPLKAQNLVPLPSDQAHYLLSVLRAREGDSVRVFNGKDGDWLGVIRLTGKKSCSLQIDSLLCPQESEPDLWLCAAPIKKAHFDDIIMKATEIGIAHLYPVLTDRTQIREVNLERCRAIAIEAAEQSERLTIPEIHPPQQLKRLMASFSGERPLFYCAEHGQARPIFQALADVETKKKPCCAILTGPEGGLTADELAVLQNCPGSVAIRLGPRILRADTAALAALSCWQAALGDWND